MNTTPIPAIIPTDVGAFEIEPQDEPVINATRSVKIMYTADSAASLLAASTLKRLVHTIAKGSLADLTYQFEFQEVCKLQGLQPAVNAYIWLDTPQKVADPEAQHYVVAGTGAGEWYHSEFHDMILDYSTRSALAVKYVRADDDPTIIGGGICHGILLGAISAFSQAAPEVMIPEPDDLIASMSDMQNELMHFHTVNATAFQVLLTYADICDAMCHMGYHTAGDFKVIDNGKTMHQRCLDEEPVALSYMNEFLRVREQVLEHGEAQHVRCSSGGWSTPNKILKVLTTKVPMFFWLAFRIPVMQTAYYHNSRLLRSGIQVTTNLPPNCSPVRVNIDTFGI